MPVIKTKGAASSQGFGEFAKSAVVPTYIEDVFSTWLYTGNGSTQTITNGIDLSTKGGLVWTKSRSTAKDNGMWDTVRGAGTGSGSPNNKTISSNGLNLSAFYSTDYLSAFNTNGFNVTYGDATYSVANQSGTTYVGWAFRKQPKFFDIQTWTGNGTAGKTITHALGSVPACIMVLCTTANYSWFVYHRSANAGGNTTSLTLNSTSAAANEGDAGIQNLTSTTFALGGAGATSTRLNDSAQTYIAYIFAHNAGGFGLTGTDNVITCGSLTTDGSGNATVNLGYEPQWILFKRSDGVSSWEINDSMRGYPVDTASDTATLRAQSSAAEVTNSSLKSFPTSTGFNFVGGASMTYIYIVVRRGPMKVPTDATKVFSPISQTGGGTVTTNFPVDLSLSTPTSGSGNNRYMVDRLRGTTTAVATYLNTNLTNAENTTAGGFGFDNNTGYIDNGFWGAQSIIYLNFQRAPGFFDEVCYTGTGAAITLNHNLGVAPELVIVKNRAPSGDGREWSVTFNFGASTYSSMVLNQTSAASSIDYSNGGNPLYCSAAPTSTTFSVGKNYAVSYPSYGLVAYLFATCPGVSKVGTYTGNGTTQTINCGFTGGARFVLIKRTNSTGDWYVYDTARGMTTVTDPYFFLNSTAAPAATLGSVTTVTTGFALDAAILAAINTSAATYIFLAIA